MKSTLGENLDTVRSERMRRNVLPAPQWDSVLLAAVTLQEGQEEGAHADPLSAAVLLRRSQLLLSGCAVCGSGLGGHRGGQPGSSWVQLEMRVSLRAPAGRSLHLRAAVLAQFALELLQPARHPPPERLRVGLVHGAFLGFPDVAALRCEESTPVGRARAASNLDPGRVGDIHGVPEAQRLVVGELAVSNHTFREFARRRGRRLAGSSTRGYRDLLSQKSQQQPGRNRPQQHLGVLSEKKYRD